MLKNEKYIGKTIINQMNLKKGDQWADQCFLSKKYRDRKCLYERG